MHEPWCGTLGQISKLFACSNTPENLARLLMPKYLQILICDNTLFSAVLKKLNSLKKPNKPLFNAAVPHACESETTKLRGQEWAVQAAGWGVVLHHALLHCRYIDCLQKLNNTATVHAPVIDNLLFLAAGSINVCSCSSACSRGRCEESRSSC